MGKVKHTDDKRINNEPPTLFLKIKPLFLFAVFSGVNASFGFKCVSPIFSPVELLKILCLYGGI